MSSRLTEVSRDRPFPHSPVSRLCVQGTLLVRMIKPNLICSHNWHVQPSFQRSVRALRLSGALLDRGPGCYAWVVPELVALGQNCTLQCLWPFLRELSKPIELPRSCQPVFLSTLTSINVEVRGFAYPLKPLRSTPEWNSGSDFA